MMGNNDFTILKAFKAHESSIVKVKYSPDEEMLAAASKSGEIFFFTISGKDDV